MERALVRRNEKAFVGWACSNCGWVYPNPSMEDPSKEHHAIVKNAFDKHKCEECPKPKSQ